jgi:hypothetical protein
VRREVKCSTSLMPQMIGMKKTLMMIWIYNKTVHSVLKNSLDICRE